MKLKNKCSVVATSHYCGNDYAKIQKNIELMGFSNIEYLISKERYFEKWAGEPGERLDLLHSAISSDSKVIIAAKAGSGITHFIKDVDYSLFSKNKKLIIGYSNLTPLINLVNQKANILSLYGPTAFQELDADSILALQKAFSMKDYSIPFNGENTLNISKKNILGKTMAGNLRTFVKSVTLNLGIDFTDKILFIEDKKVIGEVSEVKDFQAYNFFISLKNYSLFRPKALVLGGLGIESDTKLKEMLKELFPDIPIIFGVPFGHQLPNITIPVGVDCDLDFTENKINFKFPESEKEYALDFNTEGRDFSERFHQICSDPNFTKNYWPKSQKKKSIKSIMKVYRPKNFIRAKRFIISGLRDEEISQLSSPIWVCGKKYLIAEIKGNSSIASKSVFLKKEKNSWILDKSSKCPKLEDIKIFNIREKIILVGKEKDEVVVYSGNSIKDLERIAKYENIQNMILIDTNEKIGIFFKRNGKISYSEINDLKELSRGIIENSKIILDFADGEWGDITQSILLGNKKIGILGYIARKSKIAGNYFCYPFVFCFNPLTHETTSIRVLLRRGELPDGDSKSSNLYNVVLPGGIVRKKDHAILYASAGELEGYKIEIKDPFTYYEKKF